MTVSEELSRKTRNRYLSEVHKNGFGISVLATKTGTDEKRLKNISFCFPVSNTIGLDVNRNLKCVRINLIRVKKYFVSEIVIRNLATCNNDRIRNTHEHWIDADRNCAAKDSAKTTTVGNHVRGSLNF